MYRVSYIDNKGRLSHKGNFETSLVACSWVDSQSDIVPLKLLKWSDDIQCFEIVKNF